MDKINNNAAATALEEPEQVLRFELDDIDCKYGRATGICGEIPFLGSVTRCLENYERIVASPGLNLVMGEIVSCYRDLWPQLTDDEIFERMRMDIVAAGLMFGCETAEDNRFRFVAHLSAVGWTVDDVADGDADVYATEEQERRRKKKAEQEQDEATKAAQFVSEYRMVRQVFAEKSVPTFDSIPNVSSKYTAMQEALTTFMRISAETIPNFKERYPLGLRDEMACYMESVILNRGHKKSPLTRFRSRAAYSELVHYLYGIPLVMEIFGLVSENDVPAWIRKDFLYKMVYNRTCDVWATVNALMGLGKDVRGEQQDSRVFIEILYGGKSLQEAVDQVYSDVLSTIADYKGLRDKLLDVFDDQPTVKKFAQNCDTFINGLMLFFTVTNRYGSKHQVKVTKPTKLSSK